MPSKYRRQLHQRAQDFADVLNEYSYHASIDDDSLQQYSLGLAIERNSTDYGTVTLYYSPKRDGYRISTHGIKSRDAAGEIADLWDEAYIFSQMKNAPQGEFQAYVDGSYSDGITGYGAVILHNKRVIAELSGTTDGDDSIRQVAGELAAVLHVLEYCDAHNIDDIDIIYDYAGIEKWATGKWQTKTTAATQYQEQVREHSVNVKWYKVKSHVGVRWNEAADKLARDAAQSAASGGDVVQSKPADNDLATLSQRFADALVKDGIDATFDSVKNAQYGRIIVSQHDGKTGFFDLYNTKKRPLVPYIHRFTDKALAQKLQSEWDQFKASL